MFTLKSWMAFLFAFVIALAATGTADDEHGKHKHKHKDKDAKKIDKWFEKSAKEEWKWREEAAKDWWRNRTQERYRVEVFPPAIREPAEFRSYGSLAYSADRLEEATDRFHDLIHRRTGFSHLARDAHRLEEFADDFHDQVQRYRRQRISFYQLHADFQQLADAYEHLDNMLDQAHGIHHDPAVRQSWGAVAYHFRQVARQMSRY